MAISTHAPRTGSDSFFRQVYRICGLSFQPTLPARGATHLLLVGVERLLFQPTLPARGATFGDGNQLEIPDCISTHAPRTGSDDFSARLTAKHTIFQPTLPARGATASASAPAYTKIISTHAPRTGSDARCLHSSRFLFPISTHAPRTGSDGFQRVYNIVNLAFQPTLPARGATPAEFRRLPRH